MVLTVMTLSLTTLNASLLSLRKVPVVNHGYGELAFLDMSHKQTLLARFLHRLCDVANLFGSPKAVKRWNSFWTM